MTVSEELLEFIKKSPTAYQAAASASEMLEEAGFQRIEEKDRWAIAPGGKYYVIRSSSAVIAFEVPRQFDRIHIAASHADSPYFKIKENPEITKEGKYTVLNVEKYGGMLVNPWFDRPLSVAGRVFVKAGATAAGGTVDGAAAADRTDAGSAAGVSTAEGMPATGKDSCGVEERLVDFDEDCLIIPSLAIHMDRTANDGVKHNVQDDMLPLYALNTIDFMAAVAAKAGCRKEDIIGSDLYVYNHQAGTIWGPLDEFVSAPRLDDLQCAFTTLKGFLAGEKKGALSVWAMLDNEEVGSSTRQGAASTFLRDTLHRVYLALGRDFEQFQMDLAQSMMVSADNAHAVHPNYPSKADPVNRPVIGGGLVLKFAGNQKYCTDGYSAAQFRMIAEKAGRKLQVFTNRSDMPGGSTLGNISNNQVALPSVDIGLPQLAMHSPYETAGTRDTEDAVAVLTEFFA